MAHMCVKTRRLDVALLCLGNMGHAWGARALKRSMQNGDPLEVQVATLAIQLGLLVSSKILKMKYDQLSVQYSMITFKLQDEAEALFKSCGRYDLVNRLLQTRNRWDEVCQIKIFFKKQYIN